MKQLKLLLILFSFITFLPTGFTHGDEPEVKYQDLIEGSQVALALSQQNTAQVKAVEAIRSSDKSVVVNLLATTGAVTKYNCKPNEEGEVEACNEVKPNQTFDASFENWMDAAASVKEAIEAAEGNRYNLTDETLVSFKVYKRPDSSLWIKAVFQPEATNAARKVGAAFSCHLHGNHFDCHFNKLLATGESAPDEPTIPVQ